MGRFKEEGEKVLDKMAEMLSNLKKKAEIFSSFMKTIKPQDQTIDG